MYFHDNLIICYVQDPDNDRYLFQLTGGEVCDVSKEEFYAHWQEYRAFEEARALDVVEPYRPLPVTFSTTYNVKRMPINMHLRRKRKSAYLMQQPMLAHG
ncbi:MULTISPECIES: hypothetical protein [Desulfitobacterium]|uniref:Uncharacterized protein n=1 Tax=Desulfitobacterium dehalogenans (strain ATCC 51507 / DSM 9161 / JW/IU-DC1) TaxID=756499 RepID=I4AD07_DESDJ|nr:hypothetical protein [Desulfitobacterium sp. PCE1]AFM01842.1 hypothetical protein Desde_3563 [Desulfitobacterium dehalogenans ATCC 51507]